MEIRTATRQDLPEILRIYENARRFMAENGNPTQWGDGYPVPALLEKDIARQQLQVVTQDGNLEGVFLFITEPEPTYGEIFDGAWCNDAPYGTIHRAASAGKTRGIGQVMLNWCFDQCGNLRGDTHRDNWPMQRQFEQNGFIRCGIVYMEDGSPRIAYQRLK